MASPSLDAGIRGLHPQRVVLYCVFLCTGYEDLDTTLRETLLLAVENDSAVCKSNFMCSLGSLRGTLLCHQRCLALRQCQRLAEPVLSHVQIEHVGL